MYEVKVELKSCGEFETFPEAFAVFKEKVADLIRRGTSQMVLCETCTIGDGMLCLGTFAAIDAAHEWGVLNGAGELIEPAPEIPHEWFRRRAGREALAFAESMVNSIKEMTDDLLDSQSSQE